MKQYTLPNGIPVILDQMTGTDVVTALVLFKVGSRHETKSINGISHFLEHLFFKGTEHRPTTLDISRELDGVGAEFNAFTSKDYTGYYVKVASRHTALAVDILEDILFHPIFDPAEIDRERGVIIEEINMYEDNPMATAEELSEEMLFGANHPLGYRIAGPKSNINKITRKQIMDYRDTYYHPDNMIVVLAGGLPKDTLQIIRHKFEQAPESDHKTPKQKSFKYAQRSSRFHLEHKPTAQAHLALSFPAPQYKAKSVYAAQVLSTILGGNMSSRLFINVRERQGLCYYIRSGVSPYEDTGAFTIQAGFDTTRIQQAVEAIMAELSALRDAGIEGHELKNAKEYLRGKVSIAMEDSESIANWWGRQWLFSEMIGRPAVSSKDYLRKINAVTISEVNKLAKDLFISSHANLVVIGPYSKRQEQSLKKYLNF
ncbi:MAG: hypothetical protein COW24_01575 [Candidatus Kerfeldbacteria bacterium CG15_BIG_FIL_POST_REV_8_21_14_020_45_12]|uniref:Insulinase family protein n=1 Tax=Candidatus Kerfeldbacteria bacterium CG15_BIG_FIL_POST_REV_8_21_14_020_45_12 TaxID=2014247 RepID=A0A2M7H4J0_9BACT|nr:MAG: hypothetical protein COW24_01575 [Candidatus Kerfeldbacteria bacterium CG15_BIG_FIL_POST_REV_8_21_14_020_45_12]PJA94095.1 MAG: hypothetical protein CO132_00155 [Candidatus Kerfeldbacteria bacterium CG_4_9_14_3_um_filter_45_8]